MDTDFSRRLGSGNGTTESHETQELKESPLVQSVVVSINEGM